jgi:hypothetical protein
MKLLQIIGFVVGLAVTNSALGVDIKTRAVKAEDFVPAGWTMHTISHGDLNQDGVNDVVLVVQQADPNNISRNEDGLGRDELDTNPRVLLVALKKDGLYELVVKNEKILPSQDEYGGCADDLLSENGGVGITKKGVLRIDFHHWSSCGTWETSEESYTFRYQNNRFELIGYDASGFHRASGEEHSISINYSTRKKLTVTGGNMFSEDENKPIRKWTQIKANQTYDLQTFDWEQADAIRQR